MNTSRVCRHVGDVIKALLAAAAFAGAVVPSSVVAQAGPSSSPAPAVAAQYRLAPGDLIRVFVYQNPDLSLEMRITESGAVSFPLLGSVALSGLTVAQAEKRLADGLREGNFVNRPQVSVLVMQVRGNQVSVLGQVGRPGRFPLETGEVRLTDLLASAGGIAAGGADTVVVVGTRQGAPFRIEVDLPSVFGASRRSDDVVLRDGDVIWVDRAPLIYFYGEVQRPGSQRLERNMSVMQALAAAGGITQRGTEKGLRVHRRDDSGEVRILELKMTDTLRPNDVVYIRESIF